MSDEKRQPQKDRQDHDGNGTRMQEELQQPNIGGFVERAVEKISQRGNIHPEKNHPNKETQQEIFEYAHGPIHEFGQKEFSPKNFMAPVSKLFREKPKRTDPTAK